MSKELLGLDSELHGLDPMAFRPQLEPRKAAAQLEAVMRRLHVCRAYDATELYCTVKQLGDFIKAFQCSLKPF